MFDVDQKGFILMEEQHLLMLSLSDKHMTFKNLECHSQFFVRDKIGTNKKVLSLNNCEV